jgi:hypothetical protein
MNRVPCCFLGIIGLFGSVCLAAAGERQPVTVRRDGAKAILENSQIRVEFDLARGIYRATDQRSGIIGFQDARFEAKGDSPIFSAKQSGSSPSSQWTSTQDGVTCSAADRPVADALGAGRALTVECTRPGGPTLLLELALYEGKRFLALRAGLLNALPQPIRLKEFHPLTAARAFPEVGEVGQPRTLNGEGGGRDTSVERGADRMSSNDVLLTFRDGPRRHSLILGGLTYHEWMKWAGVWPTAAPPTHNAARRRELERRTAAGGRTLAAYLDCGAEDSSNGKGVQLRRLTGKPYDFGGGFAAPCFNTVLFDDKQVEIEAAGLEPNKRYRIGFSWWDYTSDGRVESVSVTPGDSPEAKIVLLQKSVLPEGLFIAERSLAEHVFAVPPKVYASGKMKILFTFEGARKPGSNAVVSEAWLTEEEDDRRAGPSSAPAMEEIYLHLKAEDPVGRQVEPGERYLPEDRFYVDFATDDPFEAAERYGLAVRAAQPARPNPYTFPTICSWYAGVWTEPGAQNHPEKSRFGIATTKGHVEEMDFIRDKTDFLRYSTIALRLVPDNYTPDNPQGWFDDRHWQEQGFYTVPYETSEKWGQAVQRRGGLAFTYFQSDRVSADFRHAHPELLLPGHRTFDYTKPAAQRYMQGVYAALRGNVSGMMFDYCDELWCFNLAPGGFADRRVTAASVYRIVFQLAKQGLGPHSWLHERPVYNPGSDMAVGLVDSQRTSNDTAAISPGLIARSGLRWYKNRVLFAYDMDSKNMLDAWKEAAPKATDRDGRRMTLTMGYVAASRLLLANSFRDLSPEALSDLERTVPYHTEPRSARPVDAFTADGSPRVYDFAVSPEWHQLTLLNTDGNHETTLSVPLSGPSGEGSLGLDPKSKYYFYDFWNDRFAGRISGDGMLRQTLRPGEARMLSVHRVENHPQFLSTDRHLMQGYVDLAGVPQWDAEKKILHGTSRVVGGRKYQVVLALNGRRAVAARAEGGAAAIEPLPGAEGLARLTLEAPQNAEVPWSVFFSAVESGTKK